MASGSRPLVVVVADRADSGARAAAQAVALGPGGRSRPEVWLLPTDLLPRARWVHTVGVDGVARTSVQPSAGRPALTDDAVAALWFRSSTVGFSPAAAGASVADQAYAATELTALLSSWLWGLGDKVVCRPEGTSPAGPAWTPTVWRSLAAASGHAVAEAPAVRTVLLAGTRVVGAMGERDVAVVRHLARSAGTRCLEVRFDARDHVVDATLAPTLGAPGHADAAAAMLREIAGRVAA